MNAYQRRLLAALIAVTAMAAFVELLMLPAHAEPAWESAVVVVR